MLFYNFIFGLLVLIRYGANPTKKQRQQFYTLSLVLLFLLSAFRLNVGCDWSGYLNQFEIQGNASLEDALQQLEPLWWAMIHGIHQLGLPYPWLNVASSALFFLGIHILARRQPDPFGFLVLLFPILIVNMPMSGIRQGAAIGLMCIAFSAFIDKKLIWFVAWTLIASALHSSAMLFLLLAPLVSGEYSKKRLALAGVLAIPGIFMLTGTDSAQDAQSRYVGSGYDAAGAIFRVGILVATSALFFYVLKKKWKETFPADYKLAAVGSLLMLITLLILPASSIISDRLGYYLIPIQTMIFARIAYLPIRKNKVLYIQSTYLSLVFVFLVWTYFSLMFGICYIPYQTWIFDLPEYLTVE